MSIKHHWICAL